MTALLIELFLKSSAVLLMAAFATVVFRRASAATQAVFWTVAFITLLLLPVTKLFSPRWNFNAVAPTVVTSLSFPSSPKIENHELTFTNVPPKSNPLSNWKGVNWIGVIWLSATVSLLGYRLLGSLQIAWLRRRSHIANTHLRNAIEPFREKIELRVVENLPVACACGVFRSTILLPAGAENWTPLRLTATIRHEAAHLSRRDYLIRWVVDVACAIFWINPLIWIAAAQLRALQERACDDLVLQAGTPASDYAAVLVETVKSLGYRTGAPLPSVALMMARQWGLEGRLLAIVDPARNRCSASRLTLATSITCMIFICAASAAAQIATAQSTPIINTESIDTFVTEVNIKATIVEAPKNTILLTTVGKIFSAQEAVQLLKTLQTTTGVNLMTLPIINFQSRNTGTFEIHGREIKDENFPIAERFEGISITLTPVVSEKVISATGEVFRNEIDKKASTDPKHPRLRQDKANICLILQNGETSLAAILPGSGEDPTRQTYVLLSATHLTKIKAQVKNEFKIPSNNASLPFGTNVPSKPGFIISPYATRPDYVDVRGFPSGVAVKDPYSGKLFRVPASQP